MSSESVLREVYMLIHRRLDEKYMKCLCCCHIVKLCFFLDLCADWLRFVVRNGKIVQITEKLHEFDREN